jgi:integrase
VRYGIRPRLGFPPGGKTVTTTVASDNFEEPRRGVDFTFALRPLQVLDLDPTDPVRITAEFVVRRCNTHQSAVGYCYAIRRNLAWFYDRGIHPFEISRDDMQLFWNDMGGLTVEARRFRLIVFHAFFLEAIERDFVKIDPTKAVKREKGRDEFDTEDATPALTQAQLEDVLAGIVADLNHIDRGTEAHRDLLVVGLMVRLCLRRVEVRDLRWGSFRGAPGSRTVRFWRKGGRPRTMAVPDDIWEVLQAWRAAYERATGLRFRLSDPVFVGLDTRSLKAIEDGRIDDALRPLDLQTFNAIVGARLAAVGITGYRYSPHCLRATGATLAFEGGATLVEVQVLLGHASIQTTRRHYLKRINKGGTPAMEKMAVRIRLTVDFHADHPGDAS